MMLTSDEMSGGAGALTDTDGCQGQEHQNKAKPSFVVSYLHWADRPARIRAGAVQTMQTCNTFHTDRESGILEFLYLCVHPVINASTGAVGDNKGPVATSSPFGRTSSFQ
jgi:hypothetical protein